MSKKNNDQVKLIKINPINNSNESLIAVAIINALIVLEAEKNELVKIPQRKELTKLLKVTQLDNLTKALDEVNNIRVRKVPAIECTSQAGITFINHPLKIIPCLVYRDMTLEDGQIKLVNSGLGDDEVVLDEQTFNNKLSINDEKYPTCQILLNSGTKNIFKDKELSCNDCSHYSMSFTSEDICLYDNTIITDCSQCCNKFIDCFKWRKPKGE